jgi:hypothetical protein
MANTVTSKTIISGSREAVIYVTIASDGTEETDLVVYDSSAVATLVGETDPLDCTLLGVYASISAATTARAFLEWDATTDVLALPLPVQNPTKANFRSVGGLPNQGGTGITGDITLTTTGLEAGDSLVLVLHVKRN